MPEVADFDELNHHLAAACREDDLRMVTRSDQSIGDRWAAERPHLRPRPAHPFACYKSVEATLNGYGLVTFDTNRYSVPADQARKRLTVRAYPFRIEIVADHQVIATHARCYGRQQDILEPLHYLSLLEQRPGAFEHARPLRQWRAEWPPVYETLLAHLQGQTDSESQAIRSFIRILELHKDHAAEMVEAAIHQALQAGLASEGGIRFCLNRLLDPTPVVAPLDLSTQPELAQVGRQPLSPACYDRLLQEAPA